MSRASRAASTLQEIGHRRQDFNPPLTPERGAVHHYTILLRHLPGALPGEVAPWCTSNTSLLFGIQLTSQDSNPDRRGPKPRVLPLHYWSIGTLGTPLRLTGTAPTTRLTGCKTLAADTLLACTQVSGAVQLGFEPRSPGLQPGALTN
jgi:hypothetical protein